MPCEMCGAEGATKQVRIEGTLMEVCSSCAKFGVEQAQTPEGQSRARVAETMEKRQAQTRPRDVYDKHPETVVPGYGEVVREARLAKGVELEEFAKSINEKKSVISKVEDESLVPSDALVKKLERALGVEIMGTPEPVAQGGSRSQGPMTLGDLLKDAIKDTDEGD